MDDLISEAWGVIDRLYDRLGTQSARGLDVDAAVILTECMVRLEGTSLERTQEEEYPKKPGPYSGPASFIEIQ